MTRALGGLELEDSSRLEVQALLDSGALRDGLRCGGDGGMGPTREWYLLGGGVGTAEAGPMAGMP